MAENPLCVKCCEHEQEIITPATVVDHIVPHKGDVELFWDTDNWQALCAFCHDSLKRREESGKDVNVIGIDGFPVEN